MLFLFKKKNSSRYALQRTGKNHPSLFPSMGGQKSTGFNHTWQPSLWHRKDHPLTANVVVLVIQPSFRSGEKEPNAAWHYNRAICCHKGQSTNLSSRKDALSPSPDWLHFLRGKWMPIFGRGICFAGNSVRRTCSQREKAQLVMRLAFTHPGGSKANYLPLPAPVCCRSQQAMAHLAKASPPTPFHV